ncbi:MAG: glycine C-acetyltransferase [Lachnospirales bacterium]
MRKNFYEETRQTLDNHLKNGTYKKLNILQSPLNSTATVENFGERIIMCSNNYVGMSNNPYVVEKAKEALDNYGCGASSVRFICGTFEIHRVLEQNIADFLGFESSITYTSCFSANNAVIPALVNDGDVIISDELNHASIIDGCRLAGKGVLKKVYKHSDMESLEERLIETKDCGVALVVTDGVFSMEGDICKLPEIIALCKKYNAILMVDDSHSTGVIGKTGRGTMEYYNITEGVDLVSGTLGKALGGAGGGFIASTKDVTELLIQKSRPHLFSNSLPPVLCAIGSASIDFLRDNPNIVSSLKEKTEYMRKKLKDAGLKPLDGDSAIIPIIVGETAVAIKAAEMMMEQGLYTTGFGFPVVPEGEARVRLQISDTLSYEELDKAFNIIVDVINKLM